MDINRRVALLSTLGAVALFASQRLDLGQASLKDLATNAVPYDEVSTSWPSFSFLLIPSTKTLTAIFCI
jgi:hypothetical protein